MIRKTLQTTKDATYSIDLPNPRRGRLPFPAGTGFFVSAAGWFMTAAHVLTENQEPDGPIRSDIAECWLIKEPDPSTRVTRILQAVQFDWRDPATDCALLKVDFAANSEKAALKGLAGFPCLRVSTRQLDEGEPIYAFGYPLSSATLLVENEHMMVGEAKHAPRTTSAIVASRLERTKLLSTDDDAKVYVIDKALNYGHSGGPIIAVETGNVHAFCTRFEPVAVGQNVRLPNGNALTIRIPSLYGIVSSLDDHRIVKALSDRNIPLATS